jgi:sortase A
MIPTTIIHKIKVFWKNPKKILGFFFLSAGFSICLYFFFPLISYQLFLANNFENGNIEVPIPKYLVVKNNGSIGDLISNGFGALSTDYTDARNWYPDLRTNSNALKINSYKLSIPKLKIENAEVATKDYDLSRHLVQYFGTSLPGENGTAVIFGHSTLPQLFDPKNYNAIFATLHTLKIGDELIINIDGVVRRYKIFSITITNPEDTNILSQTYDSSYVTLVTCTPPGTVWKRLIVRASLDSI